MSTREEGPTTADLAGGTTRAEDEPVARDIGAETTGADRLEPLLDAGEAGDFRGRWESIQTSFVDEPREAVQRADALVAELMQRLAQTFARERETLEQQWAGGGEAGTEELRIALQRYRSFFQRLLAT
jgi:hypothetical protein